MKRSLFVGVDISKATLDVTVTNPTTTHYHQFSNNNKGFTQFFNRAKFKENGKATDHQGSNGLVKLHEIWNSCSQHQNSSPTAREQVSDYSLDLRTFMDVFSTAGEHRQTVPPQRFMVLIIQGRNPHFKMLEDQLARHFAGEPIALRYHSVHPAAPIKTGVESPAGYPVFPPWVPKKRDLLPKKDILSFLLSLWSCIHRTIYARSLQDIGIYPWACPTGNRHLILFL